MIHADMFLQCTNLTIVEKWAFVLTLTYGHINHKYIFFLIFNVKKGMQFEFIIITATTFERKIASFNLC